MKKRQTKKLTPERLQQLGFAYAPPLIISAAVNNKVFDTLQSGATVAQIVWYSSDQATSAAILNWWQCQRGCAV